MGARGVNISTDARQKIPPPRRGGAGWYGNTASRAAPPRFHPRRAPRTQTAARADCQCRSARSSRAAARASESKIFFYAHTVDVKARRVHDAAVLLSLGLTSAVKESVGVRQATRFAKTRSFQVFFFLRLPKCLTSSISPPLPDLFSAFMLPRALQESTPPTMLVDHAVRRVTNITRAFAGLMQRRTMLLCPTSTCLFV